MKLQGKDFKIKAEAQGKEKPYHFSGYASTYGNTDRDGDVFEKGAFSKSVKSKKTVPLCFNHDLMTVLGKVDVFDEPEGLRVEGTFDLNSTKAKDVYSLVRMGALDSMSVGFEIKNYDLKEKNKPFGNYVIKEAELYEVSVVTIPANPQALISDVKSLFKSEEELHNFILDAVYQSMEQAMKIKGIKDDLIKKLENI